MTVKRPRGVTPRAQQECAVWLNTCLKIGWKKDMLDTLENMWWAHHNRFGKLKTPKAGKE